ncbi:hypothetical protein DKT77_17675 [Meridianimarinicoccus roseus]|uniref:Mobilization protein n=1 Tax=Meridianimarinicoccus roseus TaxID=2072018 RepID=A0A2V2L777_9RHOB|nr:hypothetical protein [Meridianimarinicoccus roseus]PWR01298.1 hypothetical protein DKT77_17675 [Meridianimarinicoccus roseus]
MAVGESRLWKVTLSETEHDLARRNMEQSGLKTRSVFLRSTLTSSSMSARMDLGREIGDLGLCANELIALVRKDGCGVPQVRDAAEAVTALAIEIQRKIAAGKL